MVRNRDLVIGMHVASHDSAACILDAGTIIAAVEEERLSRRKHHDGFPHLALRSVLTAADCQLRDVDTIAITYKPQRLLPVMIRQATAVFGNFALRARLSYILEECRIVGQNLEAWARSRLQYSFKGRFVFCNHHDAHAASAFYQSPYDEAAVLVADGYGESESLTISAADSGGLRRLAAVNFPSSLGLLYNAVTAYLGFTPDSDEGKVMAMAAYGQPRFLTTFSQMIAENGSTFVCNPRFYEPNAQRVSDLFVSTVGPSRSPRQSIDQRHYDIAASLQATLERWMLKSAELAHRLTGFDRLCLAGGVAQNCKANGLIATQSYFRDLFVHPASGDNGAALGAASLCARADHAPAVKTRSLSIDPFLGPGFAADEIEPAIRATRLDYAHVDDIEDTVARLLAAGKVVGWFQGRMEFGPRALGARSILASPDRPEMRDYLNATVKKREAFRPYGCAVLDEHGDALFDGYKRSPYMNVAFKVRSEWQTRLMAILHVDGTSRVQSVPPSMDHPLRDLLERYYALTGTPVLLNTSLNGPGEPIVCSPEDALRCFRSLTMEYLAIGPFLVSQ